MGDGTTILFGLPGVAVADADLETSGARTVRVVTDDPTAAACPICGVFSTSIRQHRSTAPKDLPYGEAPLAVRWRKAQYLCRESRCPRKAFNESIAELPPGAWVTGRLRRHAGAAVGAGASVAGVAAGLPVPGGRLARRGGVPVVRACRGCLVLPRRRRPTTAPPPPCVATVGGIRPVNCRRRCAPAGDAASPTRTRTPADRGGWWT